MHHIIDTKTTASTSTFCLLKYVAVKQVCISNQIELDLNDNNLPLRVLNLSLPFLNLHE